jgi:hypothetical protein
MKKLLACCELTLLSLSRLQRALGQRVFQARSSAVAS